MAQLYRNPSCSDRNTSSLHRIEHGRLVPEGPILVPGAPFSVRCSGELCFLNRNYGRQTAEIVDGVRAAKRKGQRFRSSPSERRRKMADKTKIQWCDSTVNPTLGCNGCELWKGAVKRCYAGAMTRRFGGTNPGYATVFEEVELAPGRMTKAAKWRELTGTGRPNKPWLNGLPRLIFVSDMSDALCPEVDFGYLKTEIIDVVASETGQRHCWPWLTKRPKQMAQFSRWLKRKGIAWPSNLWAGTSITTQETTRRIDHLLNVGDDQTIRFVSVEPQWEPVDLTKWLPRLDWVIQGGESGKSAKPFDVDWADDVMRQCRKYGIPYFLKQLGHNCVSSRVSVGLDDGHGGDWSKWPRRLRVREFPIYVGRRHSRRARQRKVVTEART